MNDVLKHMNWVLLDGVLGEQSETCARLRRRVEYGDALFCCKFVVQKLGFASRHVYMWITRRQQRQPGAGRRQFKSHAALLFEKWNAQPSSGEQRNIRSSTRDDMTGSCVSSFYPERVGVRQCGVGFMF